jgi:hypothetical protein
MKSDFEGAKSELEGLKSDFEGAKSELERMKSDFEGTKSELEGMDLKLNETKSELAQAKCSLFLLQHTLQQGANVFYGFIIIHRLIQIRMRAQPVCGLLMRAGIAGAVHDDGHFARMPIGFYLLQAFYAIHAGHVDVEKNIIGKLRTSLQPLQAFARAAEAYVLNVWVDFGEDKPE